MNENVPKILFECAEYTVIEKPAGIVTHPTREGETGALTEWLLEQYPELKQVGDDPVMRPGIVHRLDKEVSGLMVIPRTQKMYEHLKEQFQKHTMQKEYLALVYGKILKSEGIITFPIARSARGHRMSSRSDEKKDEGREAVTEYVVLRYVGRTGGERHGYTLVHLIPRTGRTHQIRAHMHSLGHPIVGDKLYRIRKQKRREDLDRIFLHAQRLGFHTLTGEWVMYESSLPEQLTHFLEQKQ